MQLPRARQFSSISFAIFDDTAREGVAKCPSSVRITTNNNTLLAEREHWNACKPNSLNTIVFDAAGAGNETAGSMSGGMYGNGSTSAEGTMVETDNLQITLFNERMYAVAISEIQIWVAANPGPRYEAEDGLIGTFIGGFEGRATGLNGTIEDGGVTLHQGGWAEIARVQSIVGKGKGPLTVIGKGTGSVVVQMNWMETNQTVTFSGSAVQQKEIEVDWEKGDNYVTMLWGSGAPWVDAVVVGSASNTTTAK